MTKMKLALLTMLLSASMISIASAQEGTDGSTIYVRVTQNREIAGTPVDLVEIKVTTSFGAVEIPLAKIDGIKMHADGADAAVIAFKNGDLVTGKVELEVIMLKTDWGTAHINTSQIDSVTSSRDARFYADVNGGTKGWRFTNAAPIPNSNVIQNPRQ